MNQKRDGTQWGVGVVSGDGRWRERSEEKDTQAMKKWSCGFFTYFISKVVFFYHHISKSTLMCYELFIGSKATNHLKTHSVSSFDRLCHILCFISVSYVSLVSFTAMQSSHVKNALGFHTVHNPLFQSQWSCCRRTTQQQWEPEYICLHILYMHDITSQTLKLITLKMVAKYVCVSVF